MTESYDQLKDGDGYYPDDITDIISSSDPEKKEILRKVARIIFEGDRYHMAMDWLEDCLLEADTGNEATTGLLFGPPGVGKSTVQRRFLKLKGQPMETRSGTHRAVVRVVTPSNPTLGNFLDAILDGLGAAAIKGGKVTDKKTAAMTQIDLQKVKLIMFDEFTHIIEDKSQKFAKNVAREVKEMLSENRCQCVLAGTVEIQALHRIYPQFRRRSAGDHYIAPYQGEGDDLEEWREAMDLIGESLPIRASKPLGGSEMAHKMLQASQGVMDNAMKLLVRATSIAYDDGSDQLTDEVFANAFHRMRRGNGKVRNPFGKPTRHHARPVVAAMDDDELGDEWTGLRSQGSGPKETFTK